MRGTRVRQLWIDGGDGIIPAHAGNTFRAKCDRLASRDHPRACGEHIVGFVVDGGHWGSSPRMRGTLNPATPEIDQTGIIPAHAGNTNSAAPKAISARDHPRACGEHSFPSEPRSTCTGSSPRMRGTLKLWGSGVADGGIIPAHAGNTQRRGVWQGHRRDHPRACGEHSMLKAAANASTGSSPRMRGTLTFVGEEERQPGIIPAHAGNTTSYVECRNRSRDHPRACGEHRFHTKSFMYCRGSSPRMRGTLGRLAGHGRNIGIIPAHAGNTPHRLPSIPDTGDHPRACGEHQFDRWLAEAGAGSSPRMRGTP